MERKHRRRRLTDNQRAQFYNCDSTSDLEADNSASLWMQQHFYESALKQYAEGDIGETMRFLILAADSGHTESQYIIGDRYSTGTDLPRDVDLAKKYLQKAADNKHALALLRIGNMIQSGEIQGLDRDVYHYHILAAECGNPVGMYNVGTYYHYGRGIKQSYSDARLWYKKSIDNSADDVRSPFYFFSNSVEMNAQVNLGTLIYYGYGGYQDRSEAFTLFSQAANIGNPIAERNLGIYYQDLGNERESFEWYLKAAHHGDDVGMLQVGICYMLGFSVDKKPDLAAAYLKASAEKGNSAAQFAFGIQCANPTEKVFWIKKAALQHNQSAIEWLDHNGITL